MKLLVFIISTLLLAGCEPKFDFAQLPPPPPVQKFTPGISKLSDLLDPGSATSAQALTLDKEGNIYSMMNFNGSLNGIVTGSEDVLIQKLTHDGQLLWHLHINSTLEMIQDSSQDEVASSVVWSEKEQAIFFVGNTKSSLIETNSTHEFDIFYGKISQAGEVLWIRHLGESSVQDSSQEERGLHLIIPPDGHPLISFQTKSNLFETNAGGDDVGIFKIHSSTGEIIKSRQLGTESLLAYGTAKGITVDGSQDERTIEGNFDLDGDKAVLPIRTKSPLIESIVNSTNYIAYAVFTKDLEIEIIKHLGVESYQEWLDKEQFTGGAIDQDNQVRSVVVLGPSDYLIVGKTNGDFADISAGLEDIFFIRYTNHEVRFIKQYGQSVLPQGNQAEQVRQIFKDKKGDIYFNGHTKSSLFTSGVTNYRSFIVKIDENANIKGAHQFNLQSSPEIDFDVSYTTSGNNFVIAERGIISIINEGNSQKSYLWKLPKL